jgi:hypothetical protein
VDSITAARIRDDLGGIVAAARELLEGAVSYEQSLRDSFTDLVAAHDGDPSAIWSIDGLHLGYVRRLA